MFQVRLCFGKRIRRACFTEHSEYAIDIMRNEPDNRGNENMSLEFRISTAMNFCN